MNKGTKKETYIFSIKFEWLYTLWTLLWTKAQGIRNTYSTLTLNYSTLCKICYEERNKESETKYFTLQLNDYILYEICYEQWHKEPEIKYFTLGVNDYLLCENRYDQRHKERKLDI